MTPRHLLIFIACQATVSSFVEAEPVVIKQAAGIQDSQ